MRIDQLSPITGEFLVAKDEMRFRAERLPEAMRQARIIFALSVILNIVFFISDWRVHGQANFSISIPARAVIVGVAIVCLIAIDRMTTFRGAQAVMLAWTTALGLAVGAIVSTHSDTALFVTLMLPSAFWLVVPASFGAVALSGIGCSVIMVCGYLLHEDAASVVIGLLLVMLLLNCALATVVVRSNRLRRQAWMASERERGIKQELAESRLTLQRMLMRVPVPLLIVSKADGRLVQANDAAVEFLGGDPRDTGLNFLGDLRADPSHPVQSLAATEGAAHQFEGVIRVADGTTRDVLVAARVVKIDGVENILVAGLDITHRKQLERRLEHLATTDPLTGLANRAGFFAAAEPAVATARHSGKPLALLMIDMDHFKRINDTYGHEAGDLALKSFAALCRRLFRSQDVVGRIGGEEFAILIPDASLEAALSRAERLRAGAERLRFRGRAAELRITASIGVALVEPSDKSADAALSRADRALYAAKREGRNRVMHADAATELSDVA
ncbi:diguanylate cyclase (GGDEF) domain-containing protein [Rhizobiales bacterium GAS188]|nr:diguanylate cyclase (GGDEF) domain-containing protein [Rhizobiales bacterium GAS188]